MDCMEKLLPKKSDRESRAGKMYGLQGRHDIRDNQREVLPVSLDPDAMNEVLKEVALKEAEEQMQLPQGMPALPGPQF